VALLCLGAFAGDRFILEPMIAGWKARSTRIATLQQNLLTGEALLERETALKDRWGEMLQRSLQSDEPNAENQVLTALGEWTRAGHLNLTDLKPRWIQEKNAPKRLEIRLAATGKLQAIARFLYELEHHPLAVRLEQVEIRSRDAKGTDLALEARFSGLVLEGAAR
jgi:hypothetical protein